VTSRANTPSSVTTTNTMPMILATNLAATSPAKNDPRTATPTIQWTAFCAAVTPRIVVPPIVHPAEPSTSSITATATYAIPKMSAYVRAMLMREVDPGIDTSSQSKSALDDP